MRNLRASGASDGPSSLQERKCSLTSGEACRLVGVCASRPALIQLFASPAFMFSSSAIMFRSKVLFFILMHRLRGKVNHISYNLTYIVSIECTEEWVWTFCLVLFFCTVVGNLSYFPTTFSFTIFIFSLSIVENVKIYSTSSCIVSSKLIVWKIECLNVPPSLQRPDSVELSSKHSDKEEVILSHVRPLDKTPDNSHTGTATEEGRCTGYPLNPQLKLTWVESKRILGF